MDVIQAEREEIQARRQSAQRRLRELETTEESATKLPSPEDIEEACALVAEAWDAPMETAERRAFIGRMVEWIEPRRNGARMLTRPLSILPPAYLEGVTVHPILLREYPRDRVAVNVTGEI